MLLGYGNKMEGGGGSGAGQHDIFVSKLFRFNEYINPYVAFVFHEPRRQQRHFYWGAGVNFSTFSN